MDNVAAYFDEKASSWIEMERSTRSSVQPAVALMAGVGKDSRVVDVGCGLGVMVPVYLDLGVGSVLGVDVSEKMVSLARDRWADYPEVSFQVVDAAHLDMPGAFDAVVVYNAYPHIMDRVAFVENVHRLLKPDGRFVVAHGSGKDGINAHHDAVARGVSLGLSPALDESVVWRSLFEIDAVVDTPRFFAFAGSRR